MYPKVYFDLFRHLDYENQVFVAMSFHQSQDTIWENVLCKAIQKSGLKPYRVKQEATSDSIMCDILSGIKESELVLCDISIVCGQRNGNVMYELGLAHACRLPEEVIIIKHDTERSVSDTQDIRHIEYNCKDIDGSIDLISGLLDSARQTIEKEKSQIVQQTRRLLDKYCTERICQIKPRNERGGTNWWHLDPQSTMHTLTIRRLLELGIIVWKHNPETREFAYHWTGLGDALWENIRTQAD